MPTKCPVCSAPAGEADRVCHYCGTHRAPSEGAPDEAAALEELHAAMAKAMQEATARGEDAVQVRDRFLQNGLIPSTPELLIEEVVRCQQYFRDELVTLQAGPALDARGSRLKVLVHSLERGLDSPWQRAC